MSELPADAIEVAQRTIGGAPAAYRVFVERSFAPVIAEELLQSYGDAGPASAAIDRKTAGGFLVLPVEQFEEGPFGYDWQRLNQKYPGVRWVVRVSRPAIDRLPWAWSPWNKRLRDKVPPSPPRRAGLCCPDPSSWALV